MMNDVFPLNDYTANLQCHAWIENKKTILKYSKTHFNPLRVPCYDSLALLVDIFIQSDPDSCLQR